MRRTPLFLYLAGAALVMVNLMVLDLLLTVLGLPLALPLVLGGRRSAGYVVGAVGALVLGYGIMGVLLLPLWIPAGLLLMASALLVLRKQSVARP